MLQLFNLLFNLILSFLLIVCNNMLHFDVPTKILSSEIFWLLFWWKASPPPPLSVISSGVKILKVTLPLTLLKRCLPLICGIVSGTQLNKQIRMYVNCPGECLHFTHNDITMNQEKITWILFLAPCLGHTLILQVQTAC